jgi:hypothetical protein
MRRDIRVLASVLKVVFPYPARTLTRKQGVIMKLTLKHKNFTIIFEEPSERLMIIFIGLIFGLHNIFSYV